MVTNFTSYSDSPMGPARSIRTVTPSNTTDLPDGVCKSIYVVEDGNLEVVALNDATPVTIPVLAGWHIPIMARRIRTGTTATVVALY